MDGTSLVVTIIIVAVVIAVAVWFLLTYNRLVRRRNMVQANWGQIDVQLVRRHELIPNLVNAVQGYVTHERATLEAVTLARVNATRAHGPAERGRAESALSQALMNLFALAEAYPNLKASGNFLALQSELANTEDRIAYARQFYNDAVLAYNNDVDSFPPMVVAKATGFERKEFFAAEVGATQTPAVRF